jgi:hypothetical protein
MIKHELSSKLIDQHRNLKEILENAIDLWHSSSGKIPHEIHGLLASFRKKLAEHLFLEGITFYKDYINSKIVRGKDVMDIYDFIGEMDGIEEALNSFLKKYPSATHIKDDFENFGSDLKSNLSKLSIRIEKEETEISDMYLLDPKDAILAKSIF